MSCPLQDPPTQSALKFPTDIFQSVTEIPINNLGQSAQLDSSGRKGKWCPSFLSFHSVAHLSASPYSSTACSNKEASQQHPSYQLHIFYCALEKDAPSTAETRRRRPTTYKKRWRMELQHKQQVHPIVLLCSACRSVGPSFLPGITPGVAFSFWNCSVRQFRGIRNGNRMPEHRCSCCWCCAALRNRKKPLSLCGSERITWMDVILARNLLLFPSSSSHLLLS